VAKALENLTVLDFSRFYAGPYCTMLLRGLGAEVLKVEIPEGGDAARTIPPLTEGEESYIFVILNRGKKSITLNLNTEKGQKIARELVKEADVVVENFSPGVMDRLGLGYKDLKVINTSLIYASISGFGHTGPRSLQPAYDLIAQAMGGLMSVTGFPDNPPTKAGPAIADFWGGLNATVSILAALRHRDRTGEGQAIDISLQDSVWEITAIEHAPLYFLGEGVPQRYGNGGFNYSPYGTYPAKDGHVVIPILTVAQWEKFVKAIGRADLIGVQKYATQRERAVNRDEIDAMVSEWTKARTVIEIVNVLSNAGLPCSPIPTFDQVANDSQLLSRQMIAEVEQTVSGKLKVPGSAVKLSKTPADVSLPAPFLGEHNYEVFCELLGYSEQEIKELADDGII
jgi:crotonobetainyl-CoA:carnitine CoA-transferase CaiB-like acyl-CoA transferase